MSISLKSLPFSLLIWLVLSSCIIGCQDAGTEGDGDTDPTELADSTAEMQTRDIQAATPVDQGLLGIWKLKENRIGVNVLSMADEERTLEFTPDGMMRIGSQGLDPIEGSFEQHGDSIVSELLTLGWEISSFSEGELIFKEIIDGEEIFYVYEKVNN
ncbi:MAG: hypothetical protein AAFR61_17275 [Bacteroidota bacterium]